MSRLISFISGRLEVVSAFGDGEEIADDAERVSNGVEAAGGAFSQERFEFGESHFDRIEIGRIGRQKQEPIGDPTDGPNPWPKRASVYEPFEARIKEWLEGGPALSAAAVLQRLRTVDPARFEEKNLRMVQRLVKAWCMEIAGLIILDDGWIKTLPVSPAAAAAGDTGALGSGPINFA